MALIKDYLKKTDDLKKEYGEKSIILMQVGAFYEVYGLREDNSDTITGSNIKEFTNHCELAISQKNICVGKNNVLMAGFRDYMIDKYIKKLQDIGYTTAVWSQDEKAAGTTRSLTGIYSPGTFFSADNNEITNNTMCLWIQKIKKMLVIGISNIDIYTGKSIIFEYTKEYSMTPDTFDELEKYVSIYKPSEMIIIHNLDSKMVMDMVQITDMKQDCIHMYNIQDTTDINHKKILNCEKQIYQQEILKRFFDENIFTVEFLNYPMACQAYCYLLDFIYQHNPNLTKKIKVPRFENCSDRMILANHSLKQLNIIESAIGNGKYASVSKFLNQCMTSMGKRKFNYTLLNPIINSEELTQEYDMCEYVIKKNDISEIRQLLSEIKDIEKLTRKILLKKIIPVDIYYLFLNLEKTLELFSKIQKDKNLFSHIFKKIEKTINNYCETIMNILKDHLILEKCRDINNLDFDVNFINPHYSEEHNKKVEIWMDSFDKLQGIQTFLNNKIIPFEKARASKSKTPKGGADFVKVHSTEKMGYSLISTKRRTTILQNQIKNLKSTEISYFSSYSQESKTMSFDCQTIQYLPAHGANLTIYNTEIKDVCREIIHSKQHMIQSVEAIYKGVVASLSNKILELDEIVKFIATVDLLYCKAFIANNYNYCKPIIKNQTNKSFVSQKGLRHPLIENLLKNELYVTNDMNLDERELGILLYGTNAVGKSSFIKAMGIAVIMAQAGFYVPCSQFIYKPYKHIFTRILGNDNLFKGLSSFAVEMLEFKTILNLADKDSLILGDELCSGTESSSAISIFLAGIDHLYHLKSNFIFATHFHEIVQLEEVKTKNKLLLKHMTVVYNKEKDKLIYDRKIKNGPGENMYGLEVCKSLHLPQNFLQKAHELRNKYNKKTSSMLAYDTSRYNSQKLKGLCEMCHEEFSTEVHHKLPQKAADDNGYIGSVHKNQLANLMSVCENCHHKIHYQEEKPIPF